MKVIITGATGYVGEGVMLELLRTPQVEKVLSVGRRSVQIQQYNTLTKAEKAKLEEYIVPDMMALEANDPHFKGYDAVYFIAGISSIGASKEVYQRISYDIPTHFAEIMPNRDKMTFIYLSGAGTDPNGKQWWMPIKGATENYIRTLGYKYSFAYRPAFMRWAKGQVRIQKMQYTFVTGYPLMRVLGLGNSMTEVAHSMLACTTKGYKEFAINARDITNLAKQWEKQSI